MKDSIRLKIETLCDRHEELASLLSDPSVINDQNRFREHSQEYARLQPIVDTFSAYQQAQADLDAAQDMLNEDDAEMRELGQMESDAAKTTLAELNVELQKHLIPTDPRDNSNIYLEIRAGTGGDEAAIFSGDLFRMYSRYADQQRWQVEIINTNDGDHGGYKEIIARIIGKGVYSQLKFESGAHRVQRVPETESQGRVHTSACTVAILPEVDDVEEVDIDMNDVRVDTFRASGAGGQHVNKTDSAIRLTHIPSGIVVECQEERSQHKNRAKAISFLQARLLDIEQSKRQAEQSADRKLQVGSGDRSERIRTYNYPQGRVTDHRINLTLYKLNEVMEGALTEIIQPLAQEHQTEQLAALSD